MTNLAYKWYFKDWLSSEKVFQLDLSERGLYRELIDLAYLNDNKTKINLDLWSRKYNATKEEIESILDVLQVLELIMIEDNILFIPSCEIRLNYIRAGRKGGKAKKPVKKTTKKTTKKKEEIYRKFKHLSITLSDYNKLLEKYSADQVNSTLDSIENYRDNTKYNSLYLTALKWLKRDNHESIEVKESEEEAVKRKKLEADRL